MVGKVNSRAGATEMKDRYFKFFVPDNPVIPEGEYTGEQLRDALQQVNPHAEVRYDESTGTLYFEKLKKNELTLLRKIKKERRPK